MLTQAPLHGTSGATHWKPQADDAHVATAPTGAVQALPHVAQFCGLEVRSTHAPLQMARPLAHEERHPVAVHSSVAVQVVVQLPQ